MHLCDGRSYNLPQSRYKKTRFFLNSVIPTVQGYKYDQAEHLNITSFFSI